MNIFSGNQTSAPDKANGIRFNPAQVLALGFATVILLGALLLTLPQATNDGQGLRIIDALFTATSATCVTGLVVLDTGTTFTGWGQLVILTLIQVGGVGFMTMATLVFLILGKKISLRERLVMKEAMNSISVQGVVQLARTILLTTLCIEGIGALILGLRWSGEMGWQKGFYYGLFHAVSSLCSAGFDLFGDFRGLTAYVEDPVVSLTVAGLIIIGGIGFAVIAEIYRYRQVKRFSLHTKLVLLFTATLITVGTLFIFIMEYNNPQTLGPLSLQGKLLASFFQAVCPRSGGYNTLNIGTMTHAAQFFMVILMFIGASPGSTGGGIKVTTFASLVLAVWNMILGRDEVTIFERRIPKELVYKSLTIALLASAMVFFVTMILTITERQEFLALLFEATSAFSTVGLSMGVTPFLSDVGRWVIVFTMFAGRVGPLTLALALGDRDRKSLRYPEEKIIVG